MRITKTTLILLTAACLMVACQQSAPPLPLSGLHPADFDTIINNKPVRLYTLTNNNGMEVCMTNYDGRIVSIIVPDNQGQPQDVVLGYDHIAKYADAKDKTHHIFETAQYDDNSLTLTMHSTDTAGGRQGSVMAKVTYKLTEKNEIDVRYEAMTELPWLSGLASHGYFNLNGDPSQPVANTQLYVNADHYQALDSNNIPKGEALAVEGTPMDFRTPRTLDGEVLSQDSGLKQYPVGGLNHHWCLSTYVHDKGNDNQVAASLFSFKTGILLEILTDEPGVTVYTANIPTTKETTGKKGIIYPLHAAVCLEPRQTPQTVYPHELASSVPEQKKKKQGHSIYRFSIVP